MADVIKVTLVNRVPNSVTVSTGVSGGGTWGTISGTITDQSDLVTYVTSERPNYPVVSPNGTSFIIVAGNDGTLAALPLTSTAPSITTLLTISGTLNVGETLTATAGTTSGEPTPTTAFQWQRSDNGTTGWADISGATGTTYLLAFNDEDKYIRVAQTEENILGTATANSASTTQIGPAVFVGLLDEYPNAAAAYSLRKLSELYLGDAIIVRRASDNATQSIGFLANGELDTASLESFCAGTAGFVTTWYDQSGNTHDAANTAASEQPQIVSSGSTILENGKAAIQWDGIKRYLDSSYTGGSMTSYISLLSASGTNARAWTFTDDAIGLRNKLSDTLCIKGTDDFDIIANTTTLGQILVDGYGVDPVSNYVNGSLESSGNQGQYLNNALRIGSTSTGVLSWNGTQQELIFYNTDQSSNRIGIETNINTFYTIY